MFFFPKALKAEPQCWYCYIQTSPSAAGKLEKWLSSPPVKAAENSLTCSDRVSLRKHTRRHIVCKVENLANRNSKNNSEKVCSRSPFKTPPSLSYCHDKVIILHFARLT